MSDSVNLLNAVFSTAGWKDEYDRIRSFQFRKRQNKQVEKPERETVNEFIELNHVQDHNNTELRLYRRWWNITNPNERLQRLSVPSSPGEDDLASGWTTEDFDTAIFRQYVKRVNIIVCSGDMEAKKMLAKWFNNSKIRNMNVHEYLKAWELHVAAVGTDTAVRHLDQLMHRSKLLATQFMLVPSLRMLNPTVRFHLEHKWFLPESDLTSYQVSTGGPSEPPLGMVYFASSTAADWTRCGYVKL